MEKRHLIKNRNNCYYWRKGKCIKHNVNDCVADRGFKCMNSFCFENKWVKKDIK